MLLGVRAVIAESFERIHRSNLIGMGVVPFEFVGGETRLSLGLNGSETVTIEGLAKPKAAPPHQGHDYGPSGTRQVEILARIDTLDELDYLRHGGILHYVLRNLLKVERG